MSNDAEKNTAAPLPRNTRVYLTKNIRATERGSGMICGTSYKVLRSYDFNEAVRISSDSNVEEIVTRKELTTQEELDKLKGEREAAMIKVEEEKLTKRKLRLEPVAALLRAGVTSVDEIAAKLNIKPMSAWSRVLECKKRKFV